MSAIGAIAAGAVAPRAGAAPAPDSKVLDVVFEGGGAKGLAFVGALQAIEASKFEVRRVVGTSAGAITALLLAAGFSGDELRVAMTEKDPKNKKRLIFNSFLDLPEKGEFSETDKKASESLRIFDRSSLGDGRGTLNALLATKHGRAVFNLNEFGGLYVGRNFTGWLAEQLKKKGYAGDETFATFATKRRTDLTVVASDTTSRRRLVLNRRTAPGCPVIQAVRMSMSLPMVWSEVVWKEEWGQYNGETIKGNVIVDGGLLSNFPLDLVVRPDHPLMNRLEAAPARSLGFLLDEELGVPDAGTPEDRGAPRMVKRVMELAETMRNARDLETILEFKESVCRLPAKGYGTVEFDMDLDRLKALVDAAHGTTESFLKAFATR